MTTYYVQRVDTYPVCNGAKKTKHPAWYQFETENKEGKLSFKQSYEWFIKHGWISEKNQLPPEYITCKNCDGEGEVVDYEDLYVALLEMGLKPNNASSGQRESSAKMDQSTPGASTASEGEQ